MLNLARASVLYIARGSFLSASDEQLAEIIAGVLDSGIRFFWAAAREDISMFQASCGDTGKGLVVPWCDQLKVLYHSPLNRWILISLRVEFC